ncbi:MAG: DegV family protein [Chloroflexota bacterium]|nr:DegV family protein [Chloroflexota bacterium]
MSRVHIVTDSAATIERAVAEQLGITIVPLTIRVGNKNGNHNASNDDASTEVYQDDTEMGHEELLLRMGSNRIHPSIIGPTTDQFRRIYTNLTRRTDQIISLHSSASLSLVCREAQKAAREFLGRCDIVVIDSETTSLGLSILVKEAARLANDSVSLGEIMRQIRGIIPRIYIVLITDTMDYLEHSHLISPAQAILGTMLGIRPFMAIEEGRIIPMEKVRSRDRAIDKLIEFASEFASIEQIAILQSTSYPTEETKMLQERLEPIVPGHEFPILLYGPLLASHIGPDGMGLVVYEGLVREVLS